MLGHLLRSADQEPTCRSRLRHSRWFASQQDASEPHRLPLFFDTNFCAAKLSTLIAHAFGTRVRRSIFVIRRRDFRLCFGGVLEAIRWNSLFAASDSASDNSLPNERPPARIEHFRLHAGGRRSRNLAKWAASTSEGRLDPTPGHLLRIYILFFMSGVHLFGDVAAAPR